MSKVDFKYLAQEFNDKVLGLVKKKAFHSHEYMSDFKKFKEELPIKERFCSSLTDINITDKEYEHVLNIWNKYEMKTIKYHDLHLNCGVLL